MSVNELGALGNTALTVMLKGKGLKTPTKISIMSQPQTPNENQVTQADIDGVLATADRPSKVFKEFLKKSPLKMEFLENEKDLAKMGYDYVPTYDGQGHYEGSGGEIVVDYRSGRHGKVTYKNGNYEQSMEYDKDGNAIRGKIIVRDMFGNIEQQYSFEKGKDGKISYIN